MPRPPELPDFPASQLFLRRLAYSLVHDEARAEDLVQETWTAWVEHRPRNVAEPRAWLARVLRNRAFNAKRSDARRAQREALAGQPDPSAPETDGTLEAQAQLIEALRKLEEPYRSTLVQRYYHDLPPKEIAERSGAPLNTVKARLARGLEKLRGEMDRRYHGDRKAWCHWLTVLGSAPPPVVVPESNAPLTGIGGSASTLAWVGVVVAMVAAGIWRATGGRPPEVHVPPAEGRTQAPPRTPEVVLGERDGASASREEAPSATVAPRPRPRAELAAPSVLAPESAPTAPISRTSGERETFDWPQYAGSALHVNAREGREDEILAPRVMWFVPGCSGQPTLRDGELYTGGLSVGRIDPITGGVMGVSFELLLTALGVDPGAIEKGPDGEVLGLRADLEPELTLQLLRIGENFDPKHTTATVAAAPVVLPSLVLARRLGDGGVTAFDRELTKEIWRWDAVGHRSRESSVPLCLASEELVLVACDSALVALRVADGKEAWRFSVNGRIGMVPASDGERVFFGTDRGLFHAVDLATGAPRWHSGGDGLGWTTPVVVGKRVIVADRGGLPHWQESSPHELEDGYGSFDPGHLSAYDMRGKLQWRTSFEGFGISMPGMDSRGKEFFAGYGEEVAPFDVDTGKPDFARAVQTGRHPFGSPTVVGKSLVFGNLDGHLYVHDLESGALRWAFRAPNGARVHDVVHSGKRAYVATSIGLFCIGDDGNEAPPEPGYVLEWDGDTTKPSYLTEKD